MATFNYLNNCLGQVFDVLESHTGTKWATFTMNEAEKVEQGFDGEEKVYMKKYAEQHDEQVYRYIYAPNLSFDDTFYQRISSVGFDDRREPWVSIMFSTGPVKSLTEVVSYNMYRTIKNSDNDFFDIKTKRVKVPVNMVLVSNDVSTLYAVTENLTLFWDRIVNISYCEFVQFPTGTEDEYEKTCQCMDISEVDLTKLDRKTRGSLVTSAYTFNLVYWVTQYPEQCKLLEKIVLDIAVHREGTLTKLEVS